MPIRMYKPRLELFPALQWMGIEDMEALLNFAPEDILYDVDKQILYINLVECKRGDYIMFTGKNQVQVIERREFLFKYESLIDD